MPLISEWRETPEGMIVIFSHVSRYASEEKKCKIVNDFANFSTQMGELRIYIFWFSRVWMPSFICVISQRKQISSHWHTFEASKKKEITSSFWRERKEEKDIVVDSWINVFLYPMYRSRKFSITAQNYILRKMSY